MKTLFTPARRCLGAQMAVQPRRLSWLGNSTVTLLSSQVSWRCMHALPRLHTPAPLLAQLARQLQPSHSQRAVCLGCVPPANHLARWAPQHSPCNAQHLLLLLLLGRWLRPLTQKPCMGAGCHLVSPLPWSLEIQSQGFSFNTRMLTDTCSRVAVLRHFQLAHCKAAGKCRTRKPAVPF